MGLFSFSQILASGSGWRVTDVICSAGPHDRPFEECHDNVCVAAVMEGTFQYRSAHGAAVLGPGSLLLGNAGQCFQCGHEHGVGDRCLSFRYSPDYFERLAADAAVVRGRPNFSVLRLPALQPLSGIVTRASAGLIGARDTYWEELSMQLAAETMELTNGQSPKGVNPTPSTVARVTRAVRMIERKTDMEL